MQQSNFQKNVLDELSQTPLYNKWLVKKFEKYIGERVLEIGSGIGNITELLLAKKRIVIPSEINHKFVKILNKRFSKKAIFLDVTNINVKKITQKFDTIIAVNVLEHIKNDQKALINISKILGRNGLLIIIVPAHQLLFGSYDQRLDHYRRYSTNDLTVKIKKAGYKPINITHLNKLAFFGWLLNSRILKKEKFSTYQLWLINKLTPFLSSIDKILPFNFGLSILCIAIKK